MFLSCKNPLAFAFGEREIAPAGRNFMEEAARDKGKGGCPKKGISRRKTRMVSIRFSELEYYALKRRSSLAGLTVSAYSHAAILNGKVVEAMKKEDMDLLRKLSGEANNLNQLAHQANSFLLPFLENEARILFKNLTEIINRLSDDWKNSKGKKL